MSKPHISILLKQSNGNQLLIGEYPKDWPLPRKRDKLFLVKTRPHLPILVVHKVVFSPECTSGAIPYIAIICSNHK